MVGAHFRPHFSEDERVFMVLKYTELELVMFWKQSTGFKGSLQTRGHRTCSQKIINNYNVQYGLCLNRHVGNSGSFCSETAFETF